MDARHLRRVVQLGAEERASEAEVELGGGEHAERRGREVDPERGPVPREHGRAEGAGRVHAHPRERRLHRDVQGHETAGAEPGQMGSPGGIGHGENHVHEHERDDDFRAECHRHSAAALRFVDPNGAPQRFFGEAGVTGGVLGMKFSRTYTDSTGTQTVTGSGLGGLGAIYLRGGMLFELDDRNELALSATAKETLVGFGNYREAVSGGNLFAADLANQFAGFTTVKLGADWTTAIASDIDITAHLGLGTTMANQKTTAYILGGGTTEGGYSNTVFAEYGAGLAWHVTSQSTIEGFIQGSSGTNIGTHAQVGAAYRMTF